MKVRRVLLVDGDEDLRRQLSTVLASNRRLQVVGEAGDGETALTESIALQPDIVVLDVRLPDLAGQDVLTRLREVAPRASVVVFTGNEAAQCETAALGVAGFVSKAQEISGLVEVLETVPEEASTFASIDLPAENISPRRARSFLVDHLASWRCDELVDDASLVVSELVANAVFHAGTPCELQLRLRQGVLRIEVRDHGSGTPDPRMPSPQTRGGRGLQIVGAISSSWGVSPNGSGKIVWAELEA